MERGWGRGQKQNNNKEPKEKHTLRAPATPTPQTATVEGAWFVALTPAKI